MDEEQAAKIAEKISKKLPGLNYAFLAKIAAVFVLGGVILAGSAGVIKNVFKDTTEFADGEGLGIDASQAFKQSAEVDRMNLSSEEVRHMGFEEEYEKESGMRKDSMSFLKMPERPKPQETAAQEESGQAAPKAPSASGSTAQTVQQQKPKPRLKGFGEHPGAGSISGFKMKTQFGGLKQNNAFPKGSGSEGGGWQGSEEAAGATGGYEQGDACSKMCAMQSKAANVNSESACKGGNLTWVSGVCADGDKLDSCMETNPMCQ